MRPTSRQLAVRDAALMATLGLLGGPGQTFGAEGRQPRPMPMPGRAPVQGRGVSPFGQDYGGMGSDWGYDFGAETAALVPMGPSAPAPTQSQAVAAWRDLHAMRHATSQRERLIEPNKGSMAKIQRYFMGITASLVLGTVTAINATGNPKTNFRPQRVTANAPAPGFVFISALQIANVNAGIGSSIDAYTFNANGQDQELDLPTISPAIPVSITGTSTTFTPPGYNQGDAYTFGVTLTGPSTMVA